jgi:hypothetical protein
MGDKKGKNFTYRPHVRKWNGEEVETGKGKNNRKRRLRRERLSLWKRTGIFFELTTEVESIYDYRLDKNLDVQEILPFYYY